MIPYALHQRVAPSIAEIEFEGGDCSDFDWILRRIRSGESVPERFSNHPLRGKLAGLWSVIVGHTAKGCTVVMVYQVVRRRVAVAIVAEHDLAYDTLRREKISKSRRIR